MADRPDDALLRHEMVQALEDALRQAKAVVAMATATVEASRTVSQQAHEMLGARSDPVVPIREDVGQTGIRTAHRESTQSEL